MNDMEERLGTLLEDAKYWERVADRVVTMSRTYSRDFFVPTLVYVYGRLEMMYSYIVKLYLDTRFDDQPNKLETYIYNWGYYTNKQAEYKKRLDELLQSRIPY